MSATSVSQILSIKDECTFCFLNFLVIGLCNSLGNYWFDIFSFLIPPLANLFSAAKFSVRAHVAEVLALEDFLSKIYKALKQDLFDIHHILDS